MSLLARSVASVVGPRAQRTLWRTVELQHPAYRTSMRRVARYQNRHAGRRCFILGNGPSLNRTDLSLLKDEVTFGTNRIYMNFDTMGFATTYYVAVNELVVEQCAGDIERLPMPKFLGWHCRDKIKFGPSMQFLHTRGGLRSWFFTDLTEGCWEGNTVTMVCLQLAFYMGFSEAVLVGVDHSYQFAGKPHAAVVSTGDDPNHFNQNYFGRGFRWHLPDLEGSEMSYRVADFVYRQHGRRVIDATVGGQCPVFEKASYPNLFSTTAQEAA